MAVHFKKAFNTGYGSITFYFNRLIGADGMRYHVSTVIRNNRTVMFHMIPKANKWMMVDRDNLEWLPELEELLSDTIIDNIALFKKEVGSKK